MFALVEDSVSAKYSMLVINVQAGYILPIQTMPNRRDFIAYPLRSGGNHILRVIATARLPLAILARKVYSPRAGGTTDLPPSRTWVWSLLDLRRTN